MISPEKFRRKLEFDIDMANLVLKYKEFFDDDTVHAASEHLHDSLVMLELLRKAMDSGANVFVIQKSEAPGCRATSARRGFFPSSA